MNKPMKPPQKFIMAIMSLAASVLAAGEHTIAVTGETLGEEWQLDGGDRSALMGEGGLVLPIGAQLSRGFLDRELAAVLSTRPIFQSSPEGAPVFEFGSIAVAFVRRNDEGMVVLLQGNSADSATVLSTFALDSAARPLLPVILGFGRVDDEVLVMTDQGIETDVLPNGGLSHLQIALSAGDQAAWGVGSLSITRWDDQDKVMAPTDHANWLREQIAQSKTATDGGRAGAEDAALMQSVASSFASVEEDPLIGETKAVPDAAPVAGEGMLEVYTPPSFRHLKGRDVRPEVPEGPEGAQ